MPLKRKDRKSNSSISSSDSELGSPDEKRVREKLSSSGSSSDGSSNAQGMIAQDMACELDTKIDLVLKRLSGIDEKLERLNCFVTNLEKNFNKLDSRVLKLESAQKEMDKKVAEVQASQAELNTQLNEVKDASENVQKVCGEKCKEIEDRLLYAEVYSRRENLRFYGIDEHGEGEDSTAVLRAFLEQKLGVKSDGIEFQRVHRIGKPKGDGPRPVIARFLRYRDRELVFSKVKVLKDSGFGLSADFPHEIVRRRKLQGKKLYDARKEGKSAYFSRTEPDKLYIDKVLSPL